MKLENYDTSKGGYIPVVRDRPELPELPDGYFFRIEEYYGPSSHRYPLEIAIRKKVWFWSVSIDDILISSDELDYSSIMRLANYLVNKRLDYRGRNVKNQAAIRKYVGDYPPKKLGNSE